MQIKNLLAHNKKYKMIKEEIWKTNMDKKWEMTHIIMNMMLENRTINEFNLNFNYIFLLIGKL